jgi:hypothetical protein
VVQYYRKGKMRMNIMDIRIGVIKQFLLDIDKKDEVFKASNQEINRLTDENYIHENRSNGDYRVIINFLYELADSVDSRLDHNRDYKLEMENK